MNTIKTLKKWFSSLLLAAPLLASGQNQVPAAINYQGRLTDTLGNPVASGYYEIEFRLWDDATQAGAGNLVWGRSFPVHVVSGGLFNILLTDDGGLINTPTTPTNSLLSAFGGEDRYLGLTIVISNGVSIANSEISPRQQLASAPYAVQSQVANSVRPLGVTSDALANGSVVASKLAANAVASGSIASGAITAPKLAANSVTTQAITNGAITSTKLATNSVTTEAIANFAVTAAKLDINDDFHLNDHTIYLRNGSDVNHGLRYAASFAGASTDGPALFGYKAGLLGTTDGGAKIAMTWANDQSVTMHGALNATAGSVSMFGALQSKNFLQTYTADTDGFVIMSGFNGHWQFRIIKSGTTVLTIRLDGSTSGANYETTTIPVAKGEQWIWEHDPDHKSESSSPTIWWRPLGVGN